MFKLAVIQKHLVLSKNLARKLKHQGFVLKYVLSVCTLDLIKKTKPISLTNHLLVAVIV